MKLPKDWNVFYQDVGKKTKALCASGIWPKPSYTSVMAWLGNFKEDKHKYLAAHILDQMIYRSEAMTESAYARFFSSQFRDYARSVNGRACESLSAWTGSLRRHSDCVDARNILICGVSSEEETGDSGSHIVRVLTGNLINPARVVVAERERLSKLEGKIIVFVDDFLGSGDQFGKFYDLMDLAAISKKNHLVYVPSMAFYQGLEALSSKDLEVAVLPLETIGERDRFFSHAANQSFRGDMLNSEADAISCYQDMRRLDARLGRKFWFGRDNASICVGFEWGCPNQSLGVMWHEGGGQWSRLLRRRGAE